MAAALDTWLVAWAGAEKALTLTHTRMTADDERLVLWKDQAHNLGGGCGLLWGCWSGCPSEEVNLETAGGGVHLGIGTACVGGLE